MGHWAPSAGDKRAIEPRKRAGSARRTRGGLSRGVDRQDLSALLLRQPLTIHISWGEIEPELPLIRGCQREGPLFYNTPKELLASVINRQ
jgi:hypothetical protein